MKYSFTTLGLFLILFVSLFIQNAFSQNNQSFDTSSLINQIIDQNTGLPAGVEEQITIEQVPSIPKPGENVSVKIISYSSNLNKATITWTLDGKVVSSQIGATSFQFTAPVSGKTSTLSISIRKEGGGVLTKRIVVSPADVDLMYEAQTYTHPYYKGKKLYTSESLVNFIAVPNFIGSNGVKIKESNLVYTWKVNGTVQQEVSGYGKNTFLTKGSLIERPTQITVEVSAVNSTLKASQAINIKSLNPEIVLYENNPILGIVYEKAVQGIFNLERPQVDFEAVPYFFSGNSRDDFSLTYNWSINGTRITSKLPNENYLVLRNDKNEEGRALINSAVQHSTNILQNAQTNLELKFKKVENISNEEFNF